MRKNSGEKVKLHLDYNSPVILSFVFICLVVLILQTMTGGVGGALTRNVFCVYRSSISPLWFVRLFGHTLGHANWNHYLGNMMTLLLVGPMLEEKYGSKVMIEAIAITSVVCGLANILIFPRTALLGASGVVFMMIVMSSVTSVKKGTIPLTLILVIILYVGEQILAGVMSTDNISQFTHIIGGILGGVFGLLLQEKKE